MFVPFFDIHALLYVTYLFLTLALTRQASRLGHKSLFITFFIWKNILEETLGLFVKLDITFKSRTRLKIYSKFATVLTNITYLTIPTQPAYRKIKAIDFIRNSIKLKSPLHRRASNSNNKKYRKTSSVYSADAVNNQVVTMLLLRVEHNIVVKRK